MSQSGTGQFAFGQNSGGFTFEPTGFVVGAKKVDELEKRVLELEGKLLAALGQLDAITAALDVKAGENAELREECKEARKKREVAEEEWRVCEAAADEAERKEAVAKELYRKLLETHRMQGENLTAVEKELERYKSDFAEATAALKKANETVASRQADLEHYEGQAAEFEKQLNAEKAAHQATKDDLQARKSALDEKEAWITGIEDELEKANEKVEEYEATENARKATLEREKERTKQALEDHEKTRAQYLQFQRDTASLREQAKTNELEVRRAEVIAKDREIAELTAANARITADRDAQIEGLTEQINQLKRDASTRINTHPTAYTENGDASRGTTETTPLDLNEELINSGSETGTGIGESSNDEGSAEENGTESDDNEKSSGGDNTSNTTTETVRIVHVPVPGPVVREPHFITRVIRDNNRLAAWFGIERDFMVLIRVLSAYLFTTTAAQVPHNGIPGLRRAPTIIEEVPVEQHVEQPAQTSEVTNPPTGTNGTANRLINMMSSQASGSPSRGRGTSNNGNGNGNLSDNNSHGHSVINHPIIIEGLLDLVPPIDPNQDQREQFHDATSQNNGADSNHGGDNGEDNNSGGDNNGRDDGSTNSIADGGGPGGPGVDLFPPPEGFWDIRNAATPPIGSTLFGLLIHLIVYYFIYVCICTFFERKIWLAANDTTRAYLFQLLSHRNRYSNSVWYYLLSHNVASFIDKTPLVLVNLLGVEIKPYPLVG